MPKVRPKFTRQQVADFCFAVVRQMAIHPYLINDGDCEDFALAVIEKMGGESEQGDGDIGPCLLWGDDASDHFTPGHDPEAHCFVYYDGFYYDAEEPAGVKSPDVLPFYMRQIMQREDLRKLVKYAVRAAYHG